AGDHPMPAFVADITEPYAAPVNTWALRVIPLLLLALAASVQAGPLFSAPFQSFDTGAFPVSVAIADLNADGRPDLAVATAGSNTVSVLLGNGDGTFRDKSEYFAGITPYSVTIGDLNGDGKPDLAVANSGSVSVLLGNGTGTFGANT